MSTRSPKSRRANHTRRLAARLNDQAARLTFQALQSLDLHLAATTAPELSRRAAVTILDLAGHATHPARRPFSLVQITDIIGQIHHASPLSSAQFAAIEELLPAFDRSPIRLIRAIRREILSPNQRKALTQILQAPLVPASINLCQSTQDLAISNFPLPFSPPSFSSDSA